MAGKYRWQGWSEGLSAAGPGTATPRPFPKTQPPVPTISSPHPLPQKIPPAPEKRAHMLLPLVRREPHPQASAPFPITCGQSAVIFPAGSPERGSTFLGNPSTACERPRKERAGSPRPLPPLLVLQSRRCLSPMTTGAATEQWAGSVTSRLRG